MGWAAAAHRTEHKGFEATVHCACCRSWRIHGMASIVFITWLRFKSADVKHACMRTPTTNMIQKLRTTCSHHSRSTHAICAFTSTSSREASWTRSIHPFLALHMADARKIEQDYSSHVRERPWQRGTHDCIRQAENDCTMSTP